VEHEAEHVLEDLSNRLAQQGLELETYFMMQQTTQEKFLEEEARPIAIKRLERSLIMDQLAHNEKIEVNEEDLQNEFGQTMTEMQYQGLDMNKIKGGKQGQQKVAEAIAMQSANRLITRRVLERIKAIATGEFKEEEETPEAELEAKKTGAAKKSSKTAKKKTAAKSKAKKSTAKKSAAKKSTSKKDKAE
jgi:trigger factor